MAKKRTIGSTILGNIVEYYDFGIYAVFAGTIGRIFFPSHDNFIQLMLAFSVFAFGFLMRPLGGIIFGYIGDKWGRRISLHLSIIGMAGSTLVIGILPSYNSIGIAAPIILILVRLIQGLCVGGEGAGSAIFILEHMANKRMNLAGSIVMASNIMGTLLANAVGICLNKMIGLDDFTWRFGFILGAIMGVVGIYFRSSVEETPAFKEIKQSNLISSNPFSQIMSSKKYAVASVVMVAAAATSIAYLIRGYFGSFFTYSLGYSNEVSLYYTSFTLIIFVLFLPIFGIIADKIGYNNFLFLVSSLIIISAIPIFYAISYGTNDITIYLSIALLGLLAAAMGAPAYPYAMRSFPPELRYSGVALGWNIGNALFGGTTPFICTLLVDKFGNIAPAYYIMATSFLFVGFHLFLSLKIALMRKKNTKHKNEKKFRKIKCR